jgi:hypothetical protein
VRIIAGVCWAKDGAKPKGLDRYFPPAKRLFHLYQKHSLLKFWESMACRSCLDTDRIEASAVSTMKHFGRVDGVRVPLMQCAEQCPMIQEFVHMHCIPSLFQELGYADAIAREDWAEVDSLFRR